MIDFKFGALVLGCIVLGFALAVLITVIVEAIR